MLIFDNVCLEGRLKNITVSLDGQSVCVIGDGAGDLLALASGILYPSSGKISRDGLIPFLPKDAPLPSFLTVSAYLNQVKAISGAESIPDHVSLLISPLLGKRISALSRTQRIKVGLASLMLPETEYVAAEAVTDGLDPTEGAEVLDLLLCESCAAALYSTDTLDAVKRAQTVIAVDGGELLFIGTHEQLTETVNAPYRVSARVSGHRDRLDKALSDIDVTVTEGEKSNFYTVTFPEGFTSQEIRGLLKGTGVTFIDAVSEGERLRRLVSSLERKEEKKRDDYEEKKAQSLKPSGLDASMFAFSRELSDENDEEEGDGDK